MARKLYRADQDAYMSDEQIAAMEKPKDPPDLVALAMKVPAVVMALGTSEVKKAEEKPDWRLYRIEIRDNLPFIIRDSCDRCGKKKVPRTWLKTRSCVDPDIGIVFLVTGLCKDCINASKVDKYLDGEALTETEAKKLFYKFGEQYEKAWRSVIAAAPRIALTAEEWQHRCKFFGGCAFCGGPIQVQAKFFPRRLNGEHTAWNVIPMCEDCHAKHYRGRLDISKPTANYRVFCTHSQFQRTKTIRLYLLHQMEKHDVYIEPLKQWRKRFFETKVLEGSD